MPHWGQQSATATLLGAAMVVVGLLGLLAIGREFALLDRMRRDGIDATGTVVRHKLGARGVDQPVIRFTDQQGRQVDFTPKRAFLNKFVSTGERVSVRYLAAEPHRARLVREEARPTSLVLMTLVCLLFLVVGLLFVIDILPPSMHIAAGTYSGPKAKLMVIAVCSLAGLCVLGFGTYRIRSLLRMRRNGVTTTGTVVRVFNARSGGGDVRNDRKAVIEFTDTGGRRIQFVADSPAHSTGDTLPIAYWPGRPEQARVVLLSRLVRSIVIGVLFCAALDGCLLFLA